MYPMVEMAGAHARYVKDVLYIYNRVNVLNDDKVQRANQLACWDEQCKRPAYAPLSVKGATR